MRKDTKVRACIQKYESETIIEWSKMIDLCEQILTFEKTMSPTLENSSTKSTKDRNLKVQKNLQKKVDNSLAPQRALQCLKQNFLVLQHRGAKNSLSSPKNLPIYLVGKNPEK